MPYQRSPLFHKHYEHYNLPPYGNFVEQNAVTIAQVEQYDRLIAERSGETVLDHYIRDNKELLVNALDFVSTGHQGSWVFPQQQIKTALRGEGTGLIPDYLLCGKSSDGLAWWVVEFKGADEPLFTTGKDGRVSFSATANKGILQLLEYIDFCNEHQSTLRDQLKLTDFREPRGMLVIGHEEELESDERLRKLKAAWNRLVGGRLEIRTHDALVRAARHKAEFHRNFG